ncbi:hypothetical protein Tco_0303725 [Tanacetum coccineum]
MFLIHLRYPHFRYTSPTLSTAEPSGGSVDEEILRGGIPRVIVLGYDELLMQPVAPPSPDYILGPEDPQTPPVPQDEDKREPMFVQAHDPGLRAQSYYPEYIQLVVVHEFPRSKWMMRHEEMVWFTVLMEGEMMGVDDNWDSSRDDSNDVDEEVDETLAMSYSIQTITTYLTITTLCRIVGLIYHNELVIGLALGRLALWGTRMTLQEKYKWWKVEAFAPRRGFGSLDRIEFKARQAHDGRVSQCDERMSERWATCRRVASTAYGGQRSVEQHSYLDDRIPDHPG